MKKGILEILQNFFFNKVAKKKKKKKIGKKHLNKYFIRQCKIICCHISKGGRKLVLDATVVYSCDLNLRTNYFSIVSFHLYAFEPVTRDMALEESGKLEATNLFLYIILNLISVWENPLQFP